ncbi:Nuclear-pore anchor [Spatholobus suberectus]|nr:Nuclear-pore anchor [Spatholobus suberectus]
MPVYGASSSLNLTRLIGLLGLGEKEAPISDHTNTLLQFILLLAIVIGIGWLLNRLAEDGESYPNANEVDELGEMDHISDELDYFFESQQGGQEHPNGELDHYFDGGDHPRAAAAGDDAGGRHGGCAFCGNFSTTRCSRCKAARYCSMKCQIEHWRSGHKHECSESEPAADDARPTHDHGPSKLVEKSEMESTSNGSHGDDGVKRSSESDVGVDISRGNNVNNFHGCEVCGSPSTTRCSRCKAVKYCSVKCLIMDWKWHKDHCIARDVNSASIERPHRDVNLLPEANMKVGVLKNSNQEEENIHSSGPLSLEFHPEGTASFQSPIEVSQDPTKEAHVHGIEWVRYLEAEVAKSRNEILLLQSERDEWRNLANFAREKFQSLKKESNYQLSALKNEKESKSDAEKKACNVIHSLHERLNHLQNAVQESITEKRKLEEHVQILESECAELKKELQEEHKRGQRLTAEYDKSHEAAQIARRKFEAVRQELQEEREHTQLLKENFRRDVIFAESRAAFAEAKLSDLYRKIRMSDYKICSICVNNEIDLAFGCGHMTCRDCGSKLSKCPICREQITNHIRLFPG